MPTSAKIASFILTPPWPELIGNALNYAGKLLRGYAHEGMYKVLVYDSTLEILDQKGRRAKFSKRKKVRYLQDNIVVYQDCAWGDGRILQNYKSHPGKKVDQYRSGYKTIILLSLHAIKNRGDVDAFHISWDIKDGFMRKEEFWETHISQKTQDFRMHVIFPKARRPAHIRVEESNHRRSHPLEKEHFSTLPDGRIRVSWRTNKPRLFENYIIKWIW
jgi:hypothetical protein